MALSRVSRFRPLFVLAAFLAAWWLAPVALRTFIHAQFYAFEAPAMSAYSRIKDLQDFWTLNTHSKASLMEAGRDLARENNRLDVALQQADTWREESARLGDLLQMPREPGFRYEFARVIRREETAWWQRIVIRKGSRAGIAPGQGVIFAGGVVGRVTNDVSADTAVIELACSPSFRIAATLGSDSLPVVYQGLLTPPFSAPQGEVRDVSPNAVIPGGGSLRLVSSSLGGEFPDGLTIGWVYHLEHGSDGLLQSGVVKLDPRLAALHEVAVLVPEPVAPSPPPPTRR